MGATAKRATLPFNGYAAEVASLYACGHARLGKRVSDWNWLIRLRRQFGLFAFFYASVHLAIYATLDAGFACDSGCGGPARAPVHRSVAGDAALIAIVHVVALDG